MIDSRHRYPQKNNVAASGTRENLSTGRAVIRRKVDCWMTFEEYERLTRYIIRGNLIHEKNLLANFKFCGRSTLLALKMPFFTVIKLFHLQKISL